MDPAHSAWPAVEDVRHLSQAEHLVVFGFRAMALGHDECPVVHRTFRNLLGCEGEAALAHLFVLARLIASAAPQRLRLHAPGCCRLGEDERGVIAAVAAAQASLAGADERALKAALAHLTRAPPEEALIMAAQYLACALILGGADLTLPGRSPRVGATLH